MSFILALLVAILSVLGLLGVVALTPLLMWWMYLALALALLLGGGWPPSWPPWRR